MKILSMTATFGKLEHQTLTLEPGLNVISAPNEWGKSTWCAFITAMLYGIETRVKSTKTTLADKERFAPWSGSPMSGRMDILWQDRKITIERRTKGRIPLGEFRAYETDTGLPVPELTAATCGEMLLGVERSVFARAGFIRLSDLPVTRDEALMDRLNALVTTGDESGDGERLAKGLKELKNRCRYNRTGLLPQAEARRDQLEQQLREMEHLREQQGRLEQRQEEVNAWIARLENHRDHLQYAAARRDTERVDQARQELEAAVAREEELRKCCEGLPQREQAQWAVDKLTELRQERLDLEMEAGMIPVPEEMPQPSQAFRGMAPEDAAEAAARDAAAHASLGKKRPALLILGLLMMAAFGGLLALRYWIFGLVCALVGVALLCAFALGDAQRKRRRGELEERYGCDDPEAWIRAAESYGAAVKREQLQRQAYQKAREGLEQRRTQLAEKIGRCTQGRDMETAFRDWQAALRLWDDWADAYRQRRRAESHLKDLGSMARTAKKPERPTDLQYSEADTARKLSDALAERQQIASRLGQYSGRMETVGQREKVLEELEQVNARIARLEDTYAALTIAQQTLEETVRELQRRFAPQISQRAQELMAEMTGGRYDRLILGEGLQLMAGAQQEDTLHDTLWRSDGTADQLYLALRLAVAEVLTPNAPLVLDDAFARFDDTRMKAAMAILRREGETKQVILFSCQQREAQIG